MAGSLARAAAVALGALSVASPHAASAATPALDLSKDAAAVFTARAPDSSLGDGVAAAGDVNGDGNADLVMGAGSSDRNGRVDSGSAYVVFGSPGFAPRMPLDPLGERGFRIDGAPPEVKARRHDLFFGEDRGPLTDEAGSAVAPAGDVNGDGLADVALSAPEASPRKRLAAGAVYVVFGKRSNQPVDLKELGAGGYRIAGARKKASTGFDIANAGDVNGDGRDDLLIGTFPDFASGRDLPDGDLFLVFGRPEAGDIDLAHLGSSGIAIRGRTDFTGPYLAPLGDVNGDGLADVIVGAPPTRPDRSARDYVIFGRTTPGAVTLGKLGAGGYEIVDGGPAGLGPEVAGPGDVNGDGRPDILVEGRAQRSFIIFGDGGTGPVDVSRERDRTLVLRGDLVGPYAVGPGDANGDGLADVLVGLPYIGPRCRDGAGGALVVYGRRAAGTVRLRGLDPSAGYRIDGVEEQGLAGDSVAWVGHDVLLGAPGTGPHGRAYLVSGRSGGVPPAPTRPCLSVHVLRQGLGRVVRTRRLRVRVESRTAGEVFLLGYGRGERPIAYGDVRFRRPGAKRAHLKLTRRGVRQLRGRARARLAVHAAVFPSITYEADAARVLVRG